MLLARWNWGRLNAIKQSYYSVIIGFLGMPTRGHLHERGTAGRQRGAAGRRRSPARTISSATRKEREGNAVGVAEPGVTWMQKGTALDHRQRHVLQVPGPSLILSDDGVCQLGRR